MKTQNTEENDFLTRAQALHEGALTLDSHVDIPENAYATPELDPGVDHPKLKCDLVKMAKGGMDGVFLAVYVQQSPDLNEQGYARAQTMAENKFAAIQRLTGTLYPDRCALALSPDDIERIVKTGKKAIAIGLENGFPIGEDLDQLDHYYAQGARYITLCHSPHNQICDSSGPAQPLHKGLSEFGKQVVTRMNELGMMCDASHLSEASFYDLIDTSRAPILVSHSGCSHLHGHDRNLTDDQLRALARNGGVIQIVALGAFLKANPPELEQAVEQLCRDFGIPNHEQRRKLSAPEIEAIRPQIEAYYEKYIELARSFPGATVTDYVNHIDHAVKIAGIDHVGIGTDFDGGGGISGFDHHGEALNVTIELVRRGYSDEEIKKIWGENLLRVWREVETKSMEN
jgi:membrane dipeptidase